MAGRTHIPANRWKSTTQPRKRSEFAGGRRFELLLCTLCVSVVRKWASLPSSPASGPECVKQTQFAQGQMEANSLLCKGLGGGRRVFRRQKQSQFAGPRLLPPPSRGRACCASRNDTNTCGRRWRQTNPICAGPKTAELPCGKEVTTNLGETAAKKTNPIRPGRLARGRPAGYQACAPARCEDRSAHRRSLDRHSHSPYTTLFGERFTNGTVPNRQRKENDPCEDVHALPVFAPMLLH